MILIIISLVVAAYVSKGVQVAKVNLSDDSVWVTKTSDFFIGRLNHQIEQLDGAANTNQTLSDIYQDGLNVFAYDMPQGLLRPLDPASVTLGTSISIGQNSQVSMGGGYIGILSESSHDLYIATYGQIENFSLRDKPALSNLSLSTEMISGLDGIVHLIDPTNGAITNIYSDSGGVLHSSVDSTGLTGELSISAVGSQPVALDVRSGELWLPNGAKVKVPGTKFALQQPSTGSSSVYVSSDSGLFQIPIDGGTPVNIAGSIKVAGPPVAPVFAQGCINAAWKNSANYVYQCGNLPPISSPISGISSSDQLVFRVNDGVVALNDTQNGNVWLIANNKTVLVNNWAQLQLASHPQTKPGGTGKANALDSTPNLPPVANPAYFGAHPGELTVLPALIYDSDPSGNILTLVSPTSLPSSQGQLEIIDSGQEFQFTPNSNASGTIQFPYTISDGKGGTASSEVIVQIYPRSVDIPPKIPSKAPELTVGEGQVITFNALEGWWDPVGNPMELTGVSGDTADTISFLASGTVIFRATGPPIFRVLNITVSDDQGESSTEQIGITVLPSGQSTPPVAPNIYETTRTLVPLDINPLAGIVDPNGAPLRLASVSGGGSAQVTPDYIDGTIGFLASTPGTYYIDYTIADEPFSGTPQVSNNAVIRVDVSSPETSSQPIAGVNFAYLSPGVPNYVHVLSNASDPNGSILVVQSVDVPPGIPVTASVYKDQEVVVTSNQIVSGSETIYYTISDGVNSTTAPIVILPASNSANPGPVTVPMTATAMEGSVVDLNPLSLDSDPNGGALTIAAQSVKVDTSQGGIGGFAFADNNTIEYQAPLDTGQAVIEYSVSNSQGLTSSSTIDVNVVPFSAQTNQAPVPVPIVARVISGSSVVINIPTASISPSGESVSLVGVTSEPQLGFISSQSPNSITYQAYSNKSGTDTFTYEMRSQDGQVASSTISVGVAPLPGIVGAPVAPPQNITAQPGRTVDVPVLNNDYSPEGLTIGLDASVPLQVSNATASISGSNIEVHTPSSNHSSSTITYTITDFHGRQSSGELTVTTDSSYKALPVVKDIVVSTVAFNAASITVNLLENASDPDGTQSDLKVVSIPNSGGRATLLSASQASFSLTNEWETYVYSVQGQDGQSSATVTVPPLKTNNFSLIPGSIVVTDANTPVTFDVNSYIKDSAELPVLLSSSAGVSGSEGIATAISQKSITFSPTHDYAGPASILVTVDDSVGSLSQEITIPVEIKPTVVQPPIFYGPTINAALGKNLVVDLMTYTTTFSSNQSVNFSALTGAPSNLGAVLSGSSLSITPQGIKSGTEIVVSFTLSSGVSSSTGSVQFDIVSSTAPLATTTPAFVTVNQGVEVAVDVLKSYVVNPIPTQPMTVLSATVSTGQGVAYVSAPGVVTFTSSKSYSGQAVVSYVVEDGTKDISREVSGVINITVLGVPGVTSAPNVVSIGDSSVELSYSTPASNGSPIYEYLISGGTQPLICNSNLCTVTGLNNGVSYQFEVAAINKVGQGPPSQPSKAVMPNVVPSAPGAPQVSFGNASVKISWAAPSNKGTQILCYNLSITPNQGTNPGCISATSYTWPGLTNGSSYTFEVQAVNLAGAGSFSPSSVPIVPATVPNAPGRASDSWDTSDPTGSKLNVTWNTLTTISQDGGDAISYYTVYVYQGSSLINSIKVPAASGTTMTYQVSGLSTGNSYTFTVSATNKAGTSQPSPMSSAMTPYSQVSNVGNLSVNSPPTSGYVTLNFSTPTPNQSLSYYYIENGGSKVGFSGPGGTVSGLTNGQSYTFQVEACNPEFCDSPSNSVSYTPDAPPSPPKISVVQGSTTVTFNWTNPSSNGCPISSVSYTIPGVNSGTVGAPGGGSDTAGTGYSQTYSIDLTATDTCGLSSTASASGSTGPPPPPAEKVTISPGAYTTSVSGCSGGCYYVDATLSGFAPNTTYNFLCTDNGSEFWPSPNPASYAQVTTNSAGNASLPQSGYFCVDGNSGHAIQVEIYGNGVTVNSNVYSPWP
ncbi:MAG: tandem-95 repeat protein [Acidimicrobiales bacterium]|nr:tandem-95 repeat protein [Acidimicrobiales bacterium]